MGVKPEIVTGHDFRAYSASIKLALVTGLMAAGCKVHDIGLAHLADGLFRAVRARRALRRHGHRLAQREWLDRREDGRQPAADLRPDEMTRLKEIVLGAEFDLGGGGSYVFVENFPDRYIADLTNRPKLKRKLKVVAACGNGTAGAFAPQRAGGDRLRGGAARLRARPHLPALQSEPRRHEDAARHARRGAGTSADVGLGFDGDGDRCGVVDNEGEEIFADKVGVMLARDMSSAASGTRPSSST